ncbi:MAG TPA: hypothetical protein VFQ23_06655 [Anaerolineales bacterium]|nr:hypothetical protein [Anaerolineales bacterium]
MLVFIHINKTAGRTVRYILRSSFGVYHCEAEPWHARDSSDQPFSAHDLKLSRKVYPRLESIGGHRVTGYTDLGESGTEFKYFAFMRDPIKTCASRFQYNIQYRGKQNLDFEEWIQRDWTRNSQTKLIAGSADVDTAIRIIKEKNIFIGLTERFDESMLLLKGLRAKNLNISYQRINVATNNSIAQKILSDEKTRQLLIEANRVDQQLYDYVSQELFPLWQKEYGPSLANDLVNYQQTREGSFNQWNLTTSRLKQFMVYRPLIYLYRLSTGRKSRLALP